MSSYEWSLGGVTAGATGVSVFREVEVNGGWGRTDGSPTDAVDDHKYYINGHERNKGSYDEAWAASRAIPCFGGKTVTNLQASTAWDAGSSGGATDGVGGGTTPKRVYIVGGKATTESPFTAYMGKHFATHFSGVDRDTVNSADRKGDGQGDEFFNVNQTDRVSYRATILGTAGRTAVVAAGVAAWTAGFDPTVASEAVCSAFEWAGVSCPM